MTAGQVGRCCVFALVLGFVIGMGTELVFVLAGKTAPRFFKLTCMGISVAVLLSSRLIHERIFLRDYKKLAEARRKRMHW
jgi:ABC-type thiamin/hydroxymethylpyrimidine transport system permease subunit